jgi:predicted ATPase
MAITIRKVPHRNGHGSLHPNLAVLMADNWDDFSFRTLFSLHFYDEKMQAHQLGSIKIGHIEQTTKGTTFDVLPTEVRALPEGWFSLGQDVDYYKKIRSQLSLEIGNELLEALGDVVYAPHLLAIAEHQEVFSTSLMRNVSLSVIHGQYARVLNGDAALTEFRFLYRRPAGEKTSAINLDFHVDPDSKPSTNIHVLIGRNGIGKTTLLNNMVTSIVDKDAVEADSGRMYTSSWMGETPIPMDYFSSVVSVSFSAFDKFIPPPERIDRTAGVAYFYIGLKKFIDDADSKIRAGIPKTDSELTSDFIKSLLGCRTFESKLSRWIKAIRRLESDENFKDMELTQLATANGEEVEALAIKRFDRMSSGHRIVLLTMTKLVETVEEKTLVIIDEPESHLHPPLLSAFTRALSELLTSRNGVAIVATHSPVVVQEVPKSCVWKLFRSRAEGRADRPPIETFGENVGILTRDIFALEVSKSGFHQVLQEAVNEGKTFDQIRQEYKGQLGFEAQAILAVMITARKVNGADAS